MHHITEKDKFMVVCSDGVFEFLSNEDVVGIVQVVNLVVKLAVKLAVKLVEVFLYLSVCLSV